MCVCVCVCVRERERERACVSACVRERACVCVYARTVSADRILSLIGAFILISILLGLVPAQARQNVDIKGGLAALTVDDVIAVPCRVHVQNSGSAVYFSSRLTPFTSHLA